MKFIIEHLEPKVYKWCIIEYKHISSIVGKENLWITNARTKQLNNYAKITKDSVSKLELKNVCVLDPEAKQELMPEDAKKFDYFVFGGILGDYPPRKRTKDELKLPNAERRNLGKEQMATDNAVYVAKEILAGRKLSELKFQDGVDVDIKKGESVHLPYHYVLVDDKPLICKDLLEKLKKQKGF